MWPSEPIPVAELVACSRRPELIEAVRSLYRELDAEIAGYGPTCWNKGKCCQFGAYGHRLFVTTLEIAYYLAMQSADAGRPQSGTSVGALANQGDTCPHAREGRCQARECRPLGCRVFHCDPRAQQWQGPMSERYLRRLRKLHDELGVPYMYLDWMAALAVLRTQD